jgi:hypothetical protein
MSAVVKGFVRRPLPGRSCAMWGRRSKPPNEETADPSIRCRPESRRCSAATPTSPRNQRWIVRLIVNRDARFGRTVRIAGTMASRPRPVSEKQPDRSEISGLAVNLRRLGAAHRMRAVGTAVHPGALDPAMHDAGVLARRDMRLIVSAVGRRRGLDPLVAHSASLAARRGSAP